MGRRLNDPGQRQFAFADDDVIERRRRVQFRSRQVEKVFRPGAGVITAYDQDRCGVAAPNFASEVERGQVVEGTVARDADNLEAGVEYPRRLRNGQKLLVVEVEQLDGCARPGTKIGTQRHQMRIAEIALPQPAAARRNQQHPNKSHANSLAVVKEPSGTLGVARAAAATSRGLAPRDGPTDRPWVHRATPAVPAAAGPTW